MYQVPVNGASVNTGIYVGSRPQPQAQSQVDPRVLVEQLMAKKEMLQPLLDEFSRTPEGAMLQQGYVALEGYISRNIHRFS